MTNEDKQLPTSKHEIDSIEDFKDFFKKEGLNFPSVAEKFPQLKKLSSFLFSTRSDDALDPYSLSWFLNEIETKKVDDYLIIGHTGHGVNSWAMHVYFVHGPFACFLQKRWGGVYDDPKRSTELFNRALLAIEHIQKHLAKAQEENKLKDNQRLVLVESDFSDNKWTWIEEGSGEVKDEAWNTAEPTFLHALASIPK